MERWLEFSGMSVDEIVRSRACCGIKAVGRKGGSKRLPVRLEAGPPLVEAVSFPGVAADFSPFPAGTDADVQGDGGGATDTAEAMG